MMNSRTAVADVARLYEQAEAESVLVEIELDTKQLRAITTEEAAAILDASELHATPSSDMQMAGYDAELNDSLEALLRLSWPVWKASKEDPSTAPLPFS